MKIYVDLLKKREIISKIKYSELNRLLENTYKGEECQIAKDIIEEKGPILTKSMNNKMYE